MFLVLRSAQLRLKRLNAFLKALGLSKENINPLVKMMYFVSGESKKLSRAKKLSRISSLAYFEQGEFLYDREITVNHELIQNIFKLANEKVPSIYESRRERYKTTQGIFSIAWLFRDLLDFRIKIYQVSMPWGGFDEGFNLALFYGKAHQDKLTRLIRENTNEIDQILCLIIDPLKKEITEEDLINKYNYPSDNLEDLDRKFYIENF